MSRIIKETSFGVKMGLYETSATLPDGGAIGESKITLGDGRVFHLAKAGAVALAAGKMCQGAAPVADHLNCAVAAIVAVGDKRVSVTLGGSTVAAANLYAGGFLHVNDSYGAGSYYKISGHLAIGAGGTGWINLYDEIDVALTTASKVTLCKSLWDGVVVAPSGGLTQVPAGVAIVPVAIGAYYWSQTWGPCSLLTQGTIVISNNVIIGGSADGACGPVSTTATDCVWGTVMRVNASTKYSLIFLRIAV